MSQRVRTLVLGARGSPWLPVFCIIHEAVSVLTPLLPLAPFIQSPPCPSGRYIILQHPQPKCCAGRPPISNHF